MMSSHRLRRILHLNAGGRGTLRAASLRQGQNDADDVAELLHGKTASYMGKSYAGTSISA